MRVRVLVRAHVYLFGGALLSSAFSAGYFPPTLEMDIPMTRMAPEIYDWLSWEEMIKEWL
jgi:hypothetical protein